MYVSKEASSRYSNNEILILRTKNFSKLSSFLRSYPSTYVIPNTTGAYILNIVSSRSIIYNWLSLFFLIIVNKIAIIQILVLNWKALSNKISLILSNNFVSSSFYFLHKIILCLQNDFVGFLFTILGIILKAFIKRYQRKHKSILQIFECFVYFDQAIIHAFGKFGCIAFIFLIACLHGLWSFLFTYFLCLFGNLCIGCLKLFNWINIIFIWHSTINIFQWLAIIIVIL